MRGSTVILAMVVSFLAGGWLFAPEPGFNVWQGGFNPFTAGIFLFLCILGMCMIHKGSQDKEYRDEILNAARKINKQDD